MHFRRLVSVSKSTRLAAGLAILLWVAGAVPAQPLPGKPIALWVPFAAGGITDSAARIVARRLGEELGRTVIVENRAGGGGRIGAAEFARAAADGHTLMFANSVVYALLPASVGGLRFDPGRDFVPLGLLSSYTTLLVCHPAVPFSDVAGLVAHAKRSPGALSFATAGAGSGNHFTSELFNLKAGVQTLSVHYRGNAPALQDVMAGVVQCSHASEVKALVDAGKLKALATAGQARDPRFPGLPTIAEAGVPGFQLEWWQGVVAPAGTPQPVVQRLVAALKVVANDPRVKAETLGLGLAVDYGTPDDFKARMAQDQATFKRVMHEAHLTLE
ncbi:MAG: tripartite tricarboxylate transporter substrate binding protein [Rubrivivax sp.]